FNAPIFRSQKARRVLGRARRGNLLLVDEKGGRCGAGGKGRWLALKGGGWVCSASDFELATLPLSVTPTTRQPAVHEASPFPYARVIERGAIRYTRLPTPEEERRAEASDSDDLDGLVKERMVGDFFLALDREVSD